MGNLSIDILKSLALTAGLALAAGCASEPAKPAPQPARQKETAAPAQATNAEVNITLPPGAAQPPAPFVGEGWQPMFDGQTLAGWRETPFAGHGEEHCQAGVIVLNMGDPFTGINWTNDFPKLNYEVALDAMRVMGSDFFCGLTVPVGTNCCSLIVGGWGGSLVGISSLDGMDASENETTKFKNFESGRWYRLRLRVTEQKIQAWIDNEKLVDVDLADRRVSVRPGEIELSQPFGLACWQTTAAFREIKYRRVSGPAAKGE
jgi:3-keto-disaccharide hydrolase